MPAYRFEALDAAGKSTSRPARGRQRARRALAAARAVAGAAGGHAGRLGRHGADAASASRARSSTPPAWPSGRASSPAWSAPGLPLERALTALADEAEDPRQRELVAHLRSEVNAGAPFARALASAPREFDDVYRGVVAAGEQSGALGLVLERLADDLEERQELKGRLIGATLYPAIVSVIAVVIVVFLVTYVVPQVATVFASSKHALPLLTIGDDGVQRLPARLGLARPAAARGRRRACSRFSLRNEAFRQRFDAGFLNLPLVGRLARGYNAARFAGTLAMLAGAGVPILKALQAAAETLSNRAMRADAMDALVQVREGAPLASALAGKKRFPGILAMFARLGEQTGQLPVMLDRAAKQLGGEVQRRALQMATILEPLLIVAMGGVVMLIVLAVLLPIIQLNSFVK